MFSFSHYSWVYIVFYYFAWLKFVVFSEINFSTDPTLEKTMLLLNV